MSASPSLAIQRIHGTLERNAAITERARAGEKFQAISDDYGVTRERVRQIVRRAGVTPAETRGARLVDFTCPVCGKTEALQPSRADRRTCTSDDCKRAASLARRPAFIRGVKGHWVCHDPRTGKTMRAERYLAQQRLGRALESTEWVTLRDGNPDNLSDENIVVASPTEVWRAAKRPQDWSTEDMAAAVAAFVHEHGRLPRRAECRLANGLPSAVTILARATPLAEACAALLDFHREHHDTSDEAAA